MGFLIGIAVTLFVLFLMWKTKAGKRILIWAAVVIGMALPFFLYWFFGYVLPYMVASRKS
ncbi:MAG TPA: hypothetical protein PKL97_04895 [Candidatus Omnitrophota bacterium]|nr:hypothetical protein [Candidatus Omnitrophota bacterium]